jgi:hypothetical protein
MDLQPLTTDNLVAILIAVVGFGWTIRSLALANRQLKAGQYTAEATRRTTQGQFLIALNDHFRLCEDIHRSLVANDPDADPPWHPPEGDWVPVVHYMGLFERCQILIESDALDLPTFERLYGYRFRHLVTKAAVRERYFLNPTDASGWSDFLELWSRLDEAYLARTGKQPPDPCPQITGVH